MAVDLPLMQVGLRFMERFQLGEKLSFLDLASELNVQSFRSPLLSSAHGRKFSLNGTFVLK